MENAYPVTEGKDFAYGDNITFISLEGYWFKRGIFVVLSDCTEYGTWEPVDIVAKGKVIIPRFP